MYPLELGRIARIWSKAGVPNEGRETSFQGVRDAFVLMTGTLSIYETQRS